jgi:hypothetical protein
MQLRCLCYWKLLDLYAISCGLWFMSLEITQELWFVTLWLWFVIPFGYDETGFTGATRDRMRSQKSSTFRGEHFSPSPVKQQNAVPSFFMAADEPRRATNSLSNFTACPLAMLQPVLDVHPLWLQLFRTDDGQGGSRITRLLIRTELNSTLPSRREMYYYYYQPKNAQVA